LGHAAAHSSSFHRRRSTSFASTTTSSLDGKGPSYAANQTANGQRLALLDPLAKRALVFCVGSLLVRAQPREVVWSLSE
jgi:hypothetical protein